VPSALPPLLAALEGIEGLQERHVEARQNGAVIGRGHRQGEEHRIDEHIDAARAVRAAEEVLGHVIGPLVSPHRVAVAVVENGDDVGPALFDLANEVIIHGQVAIDEVVLVAPEADRGF